MTIEPKLFTKNYVNDECGFVFSSNSALGPYLYDRDNDSQWVSDGENSDSTESSVAITFKEGGVEVLRDIDTVILINHNFEDPVIESWNGSSWDALDSETDLTDGTITVFSFTETETSRIRISTSATIDADAEKAIGEVIACDSLITFTRDLASYTPNFNSRKAYELQLADGSIHRSKVMNSLNRSAKYEARIRFDLLSESEIETLQGIFESGNTLTWQPESVTRPTEIYQVFWSGTFSPVYSTSYKGAGFRIDVTFKET